MRQKIIFILKVWVLVLGFFSFWIFIGIPYVAEKWSITLIPKNFVVEDNVYFETSLSCQMSVYKVHSADVSNDPGGEVGYWNFLSGKSLQEYLETEIPSDIQVGNTAAAGKACLNGHDLKERYLESLDSEVSVFTFSLDGNSLFVFDPIDGVLYYAAKD